jgi:hypothetical protein
MYKTSIYVCACLLAVANGFAPQVAPQRAGSQLQMAEKVSSTKGGSGVSSKNDPMKASRFRALDNEGSKTAAAKFVGGVDSSRANKGGSSSSGGNWFSNLFGGGGYKQAQDAVSEVASTAQGVVADVKKETRRDVNNPREKASRFRVDQQRQEGKTAIRAFNSPSPSKGTPNASSQSWNIPGKYSSVPKLQDRASKYMKGAISATDMARTLTQAGLGEAALDIIGSMPEGQKRSALFKLYKQF